MITYMKNNPLICPWLFAIPNKPVLTCVSNCVATSKIVVKGVCCYEIG